MSRVSGSCKRRFTGFVMRPGQRRPYGRVADPPNWSTADPNEKSCAAGGASVVFPLLEWHDPVANGVSVWVTIGAMVTALVNWLFGRGERTTVELAPGDRAPSFSLRGSDGRTYALADYAGRSAV